jgi:hypothetical protein
LKKAEEYTEEWGEKRSKDKNEKCLVMLSLVLKKIKSKQRRERKKERK